MGCQCTVHHDKTNVKAVELVWASMFYGVSHIQDHEAQHESVQQLCKSRLPQAKACSYKPDLVQRVCQVVIQVEDVVIHNAKKVIEELLNE